MNKKFKNVILIIVLTIIILGSCISNISNATTTFEDREVSDVITKKSEQPTVSVNRILGSVLSIIQYFCGIIGLIILIRGVYILLAVDPDKGKVQIIVAVVFLLMYFIIQMLRHPTIRIAEQLSM